MNPDQTNVPKTSQPKKTAPIVINRDGSLNVHRPREKGKLFSDLYHYFLSISWPKFILILVAIFVSFNMVFAVLFFTAGPDALSGLRADTELTRLINCFFYSVRSLDGVSPVGAWTNILVTVQNYAGILTLVIVTGLLYARFARPQARLIFSNYAIIGTYNGRPCFFFRVANERLNQIVEANMTLTLTKNETSLEGETSRRFYEMKLERNYSPLFALSWTIRHYIDENSPLFGMKPEQIEEDQVVIIASLTGIDDTFSQTITARSIYRWDELVYNKRFKDILLWQNNKMHVNLKGIHDMV